MVQFIIWKGTRILDGLFSSKHVGLDENLNGVENFEDVIRDQSSTLQEIYCLAITNIFSLKRLI